MISDVPPSGCRKVVRGLCKRASPQGRRLVPPIQLCTAPRAPSCALRSLHVTRKRQIGKKGIYAPVRHLGSHFDSSKLNTSTKPRAHPRTHHRINDRTDGLITNTRTRLQVGIVVEHPVPVGLDDESAIGSCKVVCASCEIVD